MYFRPLQDRSLSWGSGRTEPLDRTSRAGPAPRARPCADPERIARIRQRVRSGFYATPDAIDALAERLLDADAVVPG